MKRAYITPHIETVSLPHPLMTTALSGGTGDNPAEAQSQRFWSTTILDDEEDLEEDFDY